MITLPFSTPVANVLRFVLIEYIILKFMNYVVEAGTRHSARRRACQGHKLQFREGWPSFFLIPYRINEHSYRRVFPWVLVLFLNAMLLAVEFGFDSTAIAPAASTSSQELPTATLRASTPPQNVSPLRWIDRVQRLHDKCTERQSFSVFASDGYFDGESIYDEDGFMKSKVICGTDSRVKSEMTRILFNISHSGQVEDVRDKFQYVSVKLTVQKVGKSRFTFGGEIDLDVSGTIDLSSEGLNEGDFVFEVSGSCTGFEEKTESNIAVDTLVYCYLSDGDKNRFIVPGSISETSEVQTLDSAVKGQKLELYDENNSFRAEMPEYWTDGMWRDGDHLAAIKTLTLGVRWRGDGSDETGIPMVLSAITRTFCMATLYGGTSLRQVAVVAEIGDYTERASVRDWTVVMICVVLGVLMGVSAAVSLIGRKVEKWNIPVRFNDVADLAMEGEEELSKEVERDGSVVCGLRFRYDRLQYGVIRSSDEGGAMKMDSEQSA